MHVSDAQEFDQTFWQVRYQTGETPWDMGQVAPPFVTLLETHKNQLKPGRMAVLGSGPGHDAAYFGQQGFEVLGFDYVAEAVTASTAQYGQWAKFLQADIFELPKTESGRFDYVLEHTCFCAISPSRRAEYVSVVSQLLKPGGYFLGLILADISPPGPPFPSTTEEILSLFQPFFECHELTIPENSLPRRAHQERLCVFQKPL